MKFAIANICSFDLLDHDVITLTLLRREQSLSSREFLHGFQEGSNYSGARMTEPFSDWRIVVFDVWDLPIAIAHCLFNLAIFPGFIHDCEPPISMEIFVEHLLSEVTFFSGLLVSELGS